MTKWACLAMGAVLLVLPALSLGPRAERPEVREDIVVDGAVVRLFHASDPDAVWRVDAPVASYDPAARETTLTRIEDGEHTSELQSLRRISYAVFCLKKKKKQNNTKQSTVHSTNLQNQKNSQKLTHKKTR